LLGCRNNGTNLWIVTLILKKINIIYKMFQEAISKQKKTCLICKPQDKVWQMYNLFLQIKGDCRCV
jgi:hypothetical protein